MFTQYLPAAVTISSTHLASRSLPLRPRPRNRSFVYLLSLYLVRWLAHSYFFTTRISNYLLIWFFTDMTEIASIHVNTSFIPWQITHYLFYESYKLKKYWIALSNSPCYICFNSILFDVNCAVVDVFKNWWLMSLTFIFNPLKAFL